MFYRQPLISTLSLIVVQLDLAIGQWTSTFGVPPYQYSGQFGVSTPYPLQQTPYNAYYPPPPPSYSPVVVVINDDNDDDSLFDLADIISLMFTNQDTSTNTVYVPYPVPVPYDWDGTFPYTDCSSFSDVGVDSCSCYGNNNDNKRSNYGGSSSKKDYYGKKRYGSSSQNGRSRSNGQVRSQSGCKGPGSGPVVWQGCGNTITIECNNCGVCADPDDDIDEDDCDSDCSNIKSKTTYITISSCGCNIS